MADWQFDTDLDTWTPTADVAWNGSFGLPPGCAAFAHDTGTLTDGGSISINPGYLIATGNFISFYYRAVFSEIACLLGWMIDCQVTIGAGVETVQPVCTGVGDSGWLLASLDLSAHDGETVSGIQIATIGLVLNATGVIYVDYVNLGTELPPPPVAGFDLAHSAGGIPGAVMVVS